MKIRHRLVFESFEESWKAASPSLSNAILAEELRQGLLILELEEYEIDFVFWALRDRRNIDKPKKKLYDVFRPCNRVAGFITIIGGTLYASARLILLSLAFCALRYVPEGVYTTTWTRFLPNIS